MSRWIMYIARVAIGLLPRWAYPVIRGPLRGVKFILGSLAGECGGASVYINLIEPEQTSMLIKTLKQGEVFFDIGANVGYYTLLAARLVGSQGRVFAFEPVIRNIVHLYRHVSLNRLDNVTILSTACSNTSSLQIFSQGDNYALGHLVEGNDPDNAFPVPSTSVDEVVQRLGINPDVIKIDVEGAELSVLQGAENTLRDARPKIFLSTHGDASKRDCLDYLKKLNYSYEALSQNKVNASEFLAVNK